MDKTKLSEKVLGSYLKIIFISLVFSIVYSTLIIAMDGAMSPAGAWVYFIDNLMLISIPIVFAFAIILIFSIIIGLALYSIHRMFRLPKRPMLWLTITIGIVGGFLIPLLVFKFRSLDMFRVFTDGVFGGVLALAYWKTIISKW